MNKARPLLLERPGFFAAGQERGESCRGAGERAAAGRGEARSVLRGVMRRKADGDVQGNAGRTENTEEHTGHPQQSGQRASQSAQGIPGRTGHHRAHRDTPGRTGHHRAHRTPQSAQDIAGRAGTLQGAQGQRAGRAGGTAECTGHRRPHGGTPGRRAARASSLSAAEKRARRPPPEGGKRTFFCFAKKILIFWAKTVDKPLGRW